MSILIIGDIHIKISNERQTNILMLDIIDIIHKNDILFVVIMGDTLDNHGKIDMECLCRAADLFETIIQTGKHLFVLIGNHDRKNNKDFMSNRHPFRGWCGRPGITIVDKVHVHDFNVSNINFGVQGVQNDNIMKFCFVPYVPPDRYFEAISGININEISTFFSHQEFAGCKINKLSKAKCDEWNHSYPLNISGHIHDYEVPQNNLIYVGTPFQHTYSDTPNKGVWLLNIKSAFSYLPETNSIQQTGGFQLSKISLNIPEKVVLKVHYTNLQNIVIDPNVDVRLDIYGPTALIREIMNRPDMKLKFMNVAKKYREETKDENVKTGVISRSKGEYHFLNAYLNKISNDSRMLGVHMALFPQFNIDQIRLQLNSLEPTNT